MNPQIQACFEPTAETALYTQHTLFGANIAAKDVDSSRPSFKTSTGFFSVSMSTVYSQASQLQLMTDLLGDSVSILSGRTRRKGKLVPKNRHSH